MPGALGDIIDAIQTGLSQLPPAAIVVGLLFGPTLAYLGYRLYSSPRTATPERGPDELYWICPECRSANDVARTRCYHCQTDRNAIAGALRVVDRDQVLELDEAPGSPGVAVGPGRRLEEPTPFPLPAATGRDPVQTHAAERMGARPPVAIPIEPELDDDEDDVLAASQSARPTPARRRRRTTKRDGGG